MINPNDHIRRNGDEYRISSAAVLSLVSDAARAQDTTPAGKTRALRVIDEVLKVGRARRFTQIDMLETVLLRPADPRLRLDLCDSFVKHIGTEAYMAVLERAGFRFVDGGGA